MKSLEIRFLTDWGGGVVCSYFSEERRLYSNSVQKIIPKFTVIMTKTVLDLLSTDNEIIFKQLCQFIYDNFRIS